MLQKIRAKYLFFRKLNILKTLYYSLRFGGRIYIGKGKFFISGNGTIEFLSRKSSLLVGVYTTVDTPTVITIMNNAQLIVGQNSMIHRGCKIVVHEGGILSIGDQTYINENTRIHCRKYIQIGNKCAIAWNTNILDTDLHTIHYANGKTNNDSNILIGNHVWIGANSTIVKGTTIDDNCIIGANSFVIGHLVSNYIYAGNPIQQKRIFEYWEV